VVLTEKKCTIVNLRIILNGSPRIFLNNFCLARQARQARLTSQRRPVAINRALGPLRDAHNWARCAAWRRRRPHTSPPPRLKQSQGSIRFMNETLIEWGTARRASRLQLVVIRTRVPRILKTVAKSCETCFTYDKAHSLTSLYRG